METMEVIKVLPISQLVIRVYIVGKGQQLVERVIIRGIIVGLIVRMHKN